MDKVIVITGASGFMGKNLIPHFSDKGYTIFNAQLRSADWEKKIPQNATAIFHLAGKAHDTSNSSEAEAYFRINTELSKEVFNEFLHSEIRDFFYVSSIKAVADFANEVLTEETICNPQTPYGQSKLAAENYMLSQTLPAGKRLFILRPTMVHGPGNKGNLNLLFNVIKKGIPWPLAAFENRRSFLTIDNLCFLFEKLLEDQTIEGGTFLLADDEPVSTNDIIQMMSEVLNRKAVLWKISPGIIKWIAKVGDKIGLPLNSERLKKLSENYEVSNQKIKHVLNIQKLPIDSQKGLLQSIITLK